MIQLGPLLTDSIRVQAGQFNLPAALLEAMARVESSGDINAFRFERGYRYVWDNDANRPFRRLSDAEVAGLGAPRGFHAPARLGQSGDTEWMGQRTSWGPLQVMGAVAREYGFRGWFVELCGPLGVHYGAMHLARLRDRYGPDWDAVVAAYNAGSPRKRPGGGYVNQHYVNKVRKAGWNPVEG